MIEGDSSLAFLGQSPALIHSTPLSWPNYNDLFCFCWNSWSFYSEEKIRKTAWVFNRNYWAVAQIHNSSRGERWWGINMGLRLFLNSCEKPRAGGSHLELSSNPASHVDQLCSLCFPEPPFPYCQTILKCVYHIGKQRVQWHKNKKHQAGSRLLVNLRSLPSFPRFKRILFVSFSQLSSKLGQTWHLLS